jgi:hypothetical protein
MIVKSTNVENMKTEQLEQIAKEYAQKMNGVNTNNLFPETDETIGEIGAKDFIAGFDYAKSLNGWINAIDEQPNLINDENYSPNVLAICNGQLMIMCYCYNPSEDDAERGFFWANCNGQIDGDAEFDDEYDVTFWQYLPSIE